MSNYFWINSGWADGDANSLFTLGWVRDSVVVPIEDFELFADLLLRPSLVMSEVTIDSALLAKLLKVH